jgi:hypothetical protein
MCLPKRRLSVTVTQILHLIYGVFFYVSQMNSMAFFSVKKSYSSLENRDTSFMSQYKKRLQRKESGAIGSWLQARQDDFSCLFSQVQGFKAKLGAHSKASSPYLRLPG